MLEQAWKEFIDNHPLYSKKGNFDKFLEIHENDFNGQNEIFGKNFRYLMRSLRLNPVMASRRYMLNEGYIYAFWFDWEPKGETLARFAKDLEISEEDLVSKNLEENHS